VALEHLERRTPMRLYFELSLYPTGDTLIKLFNAGSQVADGSPYGKH
jgi:hypothetical protein